MTCLEVEELLSAYVDRQLDAEQIEQMDAHIADCSSCQESVKVLKDMLKQLSSLGDVPIPAAFDEELHQALMAEGRAIRQSKENQNQWAKPVKKRSWRRLSAMAAVFMVGLFSVLLYNNNLEDFANLSGVDREQVCLPDQAAAIQPVEPEETADQKELAVLDKKTPPQQPSNSDVFAGESAKGLEKARSSAGDQSGLGKALLPTQEAAVNPLADQELDSAANRSLSEQTEAAADQTELYLDGAPSDAPMLKSVSLQPEAEQLSNYLEQLAQLLDGIDYQVDSCTLSEDGTLWLIEITVIKADPAGQEIKEGAVYCGQDGKIWKKDL